MSNITKSIKTIIPLIIFAIIVVFLWKGLSVNPHIIESPYIGKPVPAFSAKELEHPNTTISNATLKGKVTLLNVFASWCISCRAEHPVLMDIRDSHRVNLYGVNYRDKRPAAIAWLKKYGDPYTAVVFDPMGKISINLGVYGTPETFVIDRKGIVRYKYIGPISPDEWKDKILPEVEKLQGSHA